MAYGAWLTRDGATVDPAVVIPPTMDSMLVVAAAGDSAMPEDSRVVATGAGEVRIDSLTVLVPVDSAASPARESSGTAPPAGPAVTTPTTVAAGATSPPPSPPSSPSDATTGARTAAASKPTRSIRKSRWVSAVAQRWITVRADANSRARIVASVGPDTRVQLGEARGSWVRIRTRGLSGWVERRHFPARSDRRR